MFCTTCGTQLPDGSAFCTACGATFAPQNFQNPTQPTYNAPPPPQAAEQGMNFDFNTNTATASNSVRYEYKVLSQKDKWFSGKFDPAILEQAINAYAQQGWRVISCATADIPGFGAARQEFITVLERQVR